MRQTTNCLTHCQCQAELVQALVCVSVGCVKDFQVVEGSGLEPSWGSTLGGLLKEGGLEELLKNSQNLYFCCDKRSGHFG